MIEEVRKLQLAKVPQEYLPNGATALMRLRLFALELAAINEITPDKERTKVITEILECYPKIVYDLNLAYESDAIRVILENKLFEERMLRQQFQLELDGLKKSLKFN